MTAPARVAALALAVALAVVSPSWGRSPGQSALDAGVASYKQGHFEAALQSFRAAVALDPSLTKAWENIGWAQHRLGNDREALRVWNTVLKLEPDNVDSWNAVGEVEFANRAWSAAEAAFARSIALRPNQRDVRLRLGQVDEQLDRPDAAATQYRAILDKSPGDAKATSRLADLEESRGHLVEAEAILRKGLGHGKDSDGALGKRLARVLAKEGDDAFAAERWDVAAGFYREAASRDRDRTLYVVNLGWAQRKSGANDLAVTTWREALDRGVPKPAEIWRAVGDAYLDAGRTADAHSAYVRATQSDPGDGAALYALAAIELDGGDLEAASGWLRAMSKTTEFGEAEAVRAADLFIRHDAISAGEALFEEIGNDPARAAVADVGLARLYAATAGASYRSGDTAAAVASYLKALDADPRNRAALRDYGWALWRQGDWAAVRRAWGNYLAAYPDLAEPHELLGRLELQHGDPKLAIAQAQAAQQAAAADGSTKGPDVLLTKAYLADGKFHRARELGARLAARYPDDLPTQTLYAETLWRNLDFPAAKTQWRRVIDMGGDSPRARHYWLRSMYETGAYGEAIAAAQTLVASGKASEPVMRLLAEDALVRDDAAAAGRWYLLLTRSFPQRVAYWTALVDVYRTAGNLRGEKRVLKDALAKHPDAPELRLLSADLQRALGHSKRALEQYRELRKSLGRNRTAFEGEVRSINDGGRHEEALARLRDDGADYLDADEQALEEASILEDMGRREEAAARRRRVTAPAPGTVDLPILLYHGIAEHERTLNVPLDRFEGEMQAIHDAGYTTITVSEMDAMLSGRARFPARPIVVSFDDARGDSFRYADPVLARLGMKATMFVPTVRIADESAFNADWQTLRRLAATGRWDFQAHGHLAHDPIAIDGDGGMAEFLVNRQWLVDEQRLETHEEFSARVEADYATCSALLTENLPTQHVVGYAFPFSEMGQLHGGNDPLALAVNESVYRKLYRYGFVQDATGYNALTPGRRGPLLLRRLSVSREWDGERLLAHLASEAPAERARLQAAQADIANAEYRRAEAALRAIVAAHPITYPAVGPALAQDLHEQGRDREAVRAYERVPTGPAWGRPEPSQRRLGADLAWETDPSAGGDAASVSDSDGRDSFEALTSGRYPLSSPVDLSGSVGFVQFSEPGYSTLAGFQGTIGADWLGTGIVGAGGWLRSRALGSGVNTLEGMATVHGRFEGHRFGAACGVTDVETVGALYDDIMRRGCEGTYEALGRNWRARARLAFGSLTDGNAIVYGWSDGTVNVDRVRYLSVGGRLEIGDSRETSPLYYAPTGLVTALGIVRYDRYFAWGASLDIEAGLGPSRDDQASGRIVGQAHVAWTQDWGARWRTTLTGDYGATPDYRRAGLAFWFGYRF